MNLRARKKSSVARPHRCDLCPKAFTKPTLLRQHRRVHTGEMPYKCPHCLKLFRFSHNLLQHVKRIHSAEKPYKCSFCPKSFAYLHDLKTHLIVHTDSPTLVQQCTKVYTRKKSLKCSYCPELFMSRKILQQHVKIMHSEEKPYKC